MKTCKDCANFSYHGPRGPVCSDGENFDYKSNTYQDNAYKCRRFAPVRFPGFKDPERMVQGKLL